MAENSNNNSSSGNFQSFVIGGLVVAVAVIGWILYSGGLFTQETQEIKIEVPGVGAIKGEVSGDASGDASGGGSGDASGGSAN